MQARIIFILIIFLSTEIVSSINLHTLSFDILSFFLSPKNILNVGSTCYDLYYLTFFHEFYGEKLEKKAKNLCEKNIYYNRIYINTPKYYKRSKHRNRRKHGRYVFEKIRWEKLKEYYLLCYKECFVEHAHLPKFTTNTIKSRFDLFQENNKHAVTYESNYRDIENKEEKIAFSIYTLLEKNKKVVLVCTPAVSGWNAGSRTWLTELGKDADVVRIIFMTVDFKNCVHFLDDLKNTILYKTIIQDKNANTLFHEACLSKNFDEIKKLSPCYFNVVDKDRKRGIDLISLCPAGNNEILKYLIQQQLKIGNELTPKEEVKLLPSSELKGWYSELVKK